MVLSSVPGNNCGIKILRIMIIREWKNRINEITKIYQFSFIKMRIISMNFKFNTDINNRLQ